MTAEDTLWYIGAWVIAAVIIQGLCLSLDRIFGRPEDQSWEELE